MPSEDSTSARLADEVKKKIKDEHRTTVLDSIVGLAVFPPDGKHGELVTVAQVESRPSDPEYVLNALETLWPDKYAFNEHQNDALEIVGRATSEVSPRTRFLLNSAG